MLDYRILRNSAKCLECNEEVVSQHRHDYVKCSCGNITVDGGKDYLKRSCRDMSKILDTSITESNDK